VDGRQEALVFNHIRRTVGSHQQGVDRSVGDGFAPRQVDPRKLCTSTGQRFDANV